MMRPCPACSRHVREATCPFCGAAVAPATRGVFAGPITRAAVFSALAGCWTGSAPAEQTTPVEHKTETHEQKKPPPTPAGTVEGTVLDTNTGQPVAYARVVVGGTNVGTETDAQGHYQLTGLTPGEYTLTISARSNNPRAGGATTQVHVTVGEQGARADAELAVPQFRYNPTNTPMPYGAPPARKRVV